MYFKGLYLTDRVPDELCTEVHDIVQGTGIKTIPKKKKCKQAKWLSGEALQIAVKRREAKRKGEKKRYTHLNDQLRQHIKKQRHYFDDRGPYSHSYGFSSMCGYKRWTINKAVP